VLLRNAHLPPRASSTKLDEHRLQLGGDPTPRAQSPARPQQRKLVTHLRQQHVDPTRDLIDRSFFMLLKPNKPIERITREPPVPPCSTNAIEHPSVGPALHTGRPGPNQSGGFGCTEEVHEEP
jgi:hypothetical protein